MIKHRPRSDCLCPRSHPDSFHIGKYGVMYAIYSSTCKDGHGKLEEERTSELSTELTNLFLDGSEHWQSDYTDEASIAIDLPQKMLVSHRCAVTVGPIGSLYMEIICLKSLPRTLVKIAANK